MSSHLTLSQSIDRAAAELPEDYVIKLCVQRGAGWVTLYGPEGRCVGFDESEMGNVFPDDTGLTEAVERAIDYAIADDAKMAPLRKAAMDEAEGES
jgi:hypothetical protein